MNENLDKKINTGLTAEEVKAKIAEGLDNKDLNVKTKSYRQIVSGNLFTLFNLVNTILLVCVLIAGSLKNALFYGVVLWNLAIGIIQEVRAKKTIEKLSLITAPKAYVLRDAKIITVQSKDIVLGDTMSLKSGNQVCADCIILKGECQVNESLITGENEPVFKKAGDELLSGSYIIAGSVLAECVHIAEENYVNKITMGAKYVKKSNSVILSSVKSVVKVVAIALIPLAALMIWKNFFAIDQSFSDAMIATVASVSAMIPGGLVLLVSLVMTVSVIRLSFHNTLAQDLYCVENLARVDVMCLDKTGTITEGALVVEKIEDAGGFDEAELKEFALRMSDENSTITAIRNYFAIKDDERDEAPMEEQIPFSSDIKWSLLKKDDGSLILGAPEIVLKGQLSKEQKDLIENAAADSKRVVVFAKSFGFPEGRSLPQSIEPEALIVIGDKVRENARDTLDYFEKENVCVKVISGDNPVTVSHVASEAGLKDAEKYIDASELKTYEDIEEAVGKYTIFGRVTPYQKLDIVKALKSQGHTVAMIGDGANDVLALKEADCSVAMQSGSDAARNVASLVLLDSDFASMPVILAEGRKSINNLQRSAALYLTKTTYAFALTIMFIFLAFTYPFQNIQVTLIGAVTIGMPSFFLALEPNAERIKKHFLRNVFSRAVPSGVMTVAAILITAMMVKLSLGGTTEQTQTASTFAAIICGIIVVFNVAGKMNWLKWALICFITLVALGAILVLPGIFSIVALTWNMWVVIICCSVGFLILHTILFRLIFPAMERNGK